MTQEIWKPIPHYEGIYEASNKGQIRTCNGKTTTTKMHGVRHWKQRILKQKVDKYKNHRVTLWKDGKDKDFLVHRLIAMSFLGESDLTVNHIDGNRHNNNIENLEWCSVAENIQKGFETGLFSCQKKVVIINKETSDKKTYRNLTIASKDMGYNHGYISNCMKKGKTENDKYKWELIK